MKPIHHGAYKKVQRSTGWINVLDDLPQTTRGSELSSQLTEWTVHLFLLLDPVLFVSAVEDDDAPVSVSLLLLLCPPELALSCDVSDISSANNLCLLLE